MHMLKDERRKNQKKWKKRKDYGSRWLVEIVFSSFKSMLGESVMAIKWPYIIREISNKVNVYNWLLDVSEDAMNSVSA